MLEKSKRSFFFAVLAIFIICETFLIQASAIHFSILGFQKQVQELIIKPEVYECQDPVLQINPAVFDKSVSTIMTERKWWPDIDWRRQLFGGSEDDEEVEEEEEDKGI